MGARSERNGRLDLAFLHAAVTARAEQDGISIRELCRRLEISPGTISRLKLDRAPDAFALVSLLAWLDAPAHLLLPGAAAHPARRRAKPLPDIVRRARDQAETSRDR